MISAFSSSRRVCASPAWLWPAISQPPLNPVIFSRNEPTEPRVAVNASPLRGVCSASRAGGSAGAPGLPPVIVVPRAFADQRNTGAPSASMSLPASPPALGPAPARATRWLSAAGFCRATARRPTSRSSFCSVRWLATTRLSTITPMM